MKFVAFLLVILAVAVAMLLLGWVYVRDSGDSTEIIIDKQEVQRDTDAAVDATKDFAEDAGDKLKRLGGDVEQKLDESIETEQESRDPQESDPHPLEKDRSVAPETVDQP
ncbi:MAG: hypothetical protein RIC55_01120 [Pirellulaceae bacterium]